MDTYLSKNDTSAMKAIAIILMMMHHLFYFPERIAGGSLTNYISIFSRTSISIMGSFGKICVSLFFFLGGYGLYVSSKGKNFDLVGRVTKLYLSYWKVFLIFIPIAFCFFSKQPIYCEQSDICTRFQYFSWNDFFLNLFAVKNSYVSEWWFLRSYLFCIATFPFIRLVAEKHMAPTNVFLVIVASVLIGFFFPALSSIDVFSSLSFNQLYGLLFCQLCPYVACFWMGVVCAKDGLLSELSNLIKKNNYNNCFFDIIIIVMIIIIREFGWGENFDIFFVPLFIVVVKDILSRFKHLYDFVSLLGKESTNMWLIHTLFCYYFYSVVKMVVLPRYSLGCLLVLLSLTYCASIATTKFWEFISSGYGILKQKIEVK